MNFLTDRQYKLLTGPLDRGRVKRLKGNDYLEQWDVRRWLIRVFGFGGWSFERVDCQLVKELEHRSGNAKDDRPRWTVVYRYEGRLTVYSEDRLFLAVYEDAAIGDAQNQPILGEAHDQALKSAASGALKRCAVNLGDQFGLGLYGEVEGPVVKWSMVRPETDNVNFMVSNLEEGKEDA